MSLLQGLVSDIIPSQTCHMNICLILDGYGAMDI